MWTDDQLFTTARYAPSSKLLALRMQEAKTHELQDFQLIQKSTSLAARAYLESPFFILAYKMCQRFIFLQSPERSNEHFLRYNQREPARKEEAGVALLEQLFEEVKGSPEAEVKKIQPVMYHLDYDKYKKEATQYQEQCEYYWHSNPEKETLDNSWDGT